VVINQVNVTDVSALKTKDDAPVCPNGHAPEALQVALERVKPESREIHIFGYSGTAENSKNVLNLLDQIRADSFALAVNKKPLESLVPKTLNHPLGASTALLSEHLNLTSDTCQGEIWKAGTQRKILG